MAEQKREIKTLGEYQRQMDRFENCGDGHILPDLYLVVRIDAHRFGPAWSDFPDRGYPFDPSFVRALIDTARYVMCSGFKTRYAFVHGDEISVLLDPAESANQRRRSKLVSLLASVGSVGFQKEFGRPAIFHSKLSELPTLNHVADYFLWQRKVAARNFYARTLGILMSEKGLASKEIDLRLSKMTEEERPQVAAEFGLLPSSITPYHLFGAGLWWEEPARGSETGNAALVESVALPAADEEYAKFLDLRFSGPGFAAADDLIAVPARPAGTDAPAGRVQAAPAAAPAGKPGAAPAEKFRLGFRSGRR